MYLYLSKRINIPKVTELTSISWNGFLDFICVGGSGGLIKMLKLSGSSIIESSRISLNQSLLSHKSDIKKIRWNEHYRKLTSFDSSGKIVVWLLHQQRWFEEMVNNRKKSVVRDLRWSCRGRLICIVYQDGLVILGTVDGNRVWSKQFKEGMKFASWSPDDKYIILVDIRNRVHLVSSENATVVRRMNLVYGRRKKSAEIIGVEWYSALLGMEMSKVASKFSFSKRLCICYNTGVIELYRNIQDKSPMVINTDLTVSDCKFSFDGCFLAVGGRGALLEGEKSSKRGGTVNRVVIYDTSNGQQLSSLRINSSKNIRELSWDRHGLRIGIVIGTSIYFAVVRHTYVYGIHGSVLVFARPHCLTFWNQRTGEMDIKRGEKYRNIVHVGANDKLLYIIQKQRLTSEDQIQQQNILSSFGNGSSNINGSDDEMTKYKYRVGFLDGIGNDVGEITLYAMPFFKSIILSNDHLLITSKFGVCVIRVINHNNNSNKGGSVNVKGSKQSEMTYEKFQYHINDSACKNVQVITGVGNNEITAVCGHYPSFFISRESGKIQIYVIKQHPQQHSRTKSKLQQQQLSISIKATINFKFFPLSMFISKSLDRLGIIDIQHQLKLYNVKLNRETWKLEKMSKQDVERKDIWDIKFCDPSSITDSTSSGGGSDGIGSSANSGGHGDTSSNLFCVMEKEKLMVFRDNKIEEPVKCNGYVTGFKELKVHTARLDHLAKLIDSYVPLQQKNPQTPKLLKPPSLSSIFISFKTKALRDAKEIIKNISVESGYRYILENDDLILWSLLAKGSLKKGQLSYATKAFVKLRDYRGIKFVNDLMSISNQKLRKAAIHIYLGHFQQAEKIYKSLDRNDLIVSMKKKYHDHFWLINYLKKQENEVLSGSGSAIDTRERSELHNMIGDYFYERRMFSKAKVHYEKAQNTSKLVKCLYKLGNYIELSKMAPSIANSSILSKMAVMFKRIGISPVSILVRLGRKQEALNYAVKYNDYTSAMMLIKRFDFSYDLSAVVSRKSKNFVGNTNNVIELYKSCGNISGLIKIFSNSLIKKQKSFLAKKMLSVRMATMIEKILLKNMKKKFDIARNIWATAEAFHYLLKANSLHYKKKNSTGALHNILRCLNYLSIPVFAKHSKMVYSNITLFAFHVKKWKICSKFLSKLELKSKQNFDMNNEEGGSKNDDAERGSHNKRKMQITTILFGGEASGPKKLKRNPYQSLAIKIFLRMKDGDRSKKDGGEEEEEEEEDEESEFTMRCENCKKNTESYLNLCSNCSNENKMVSVFSGRVIDVSKEKIWTCSVCSHVTTEEERKKFEYCPLCHKKEKN